MLISRDFAAIGRYLRRQRNRYMEPFGLKGLHARMLLDIAEHPGLSQDALAQKSGFDKSNIARQMAVLEEGGFIRRTPSAQDKRAMEVYPTEKTQALRPQLLEAMEQWEQKLTCALTEEEKAQLTGLLEKLRTAATEDEG